MRAVLAAPRFAAAVLAGCLVFGLSAVVFLGAAEDVISKNGAARVDAQRLDWFIDHRTGPLVTVARFINTWASVAVVCVLAALVGVWLWHRGLPVILSAVPLTAVVFAEALAAVLKVTVGRPRPPASWRLVSESDASFPSGHATAATAFGVSLAVVVAAHVLVRVWPRVVVVGAGLALPALVGLSRLELGVHYPTDVVAGLALGTCTALAVTALAAWTVEAEPLSRTRARGWIARARGVLLARRIRPSLRAVA